MGEYSSRNLSSARLTLFHRFCSEKRSNSKYRYLAPSTLSYYKDALVDPITLFLRTRHSCILKRKEIGQREMLQKFYLTDQAIKAALQLYRFLIDIPLEDEISGTQLAVHVHRVLVGLLTSAPPTNIRAGGLFDLTLALRAYKGPKHGFGPATIASACCAMFQYGMRSIVVHIARLGGSTANYERIEKPEDGEEVVLDNITTDQEESTEERVPTLDECDPLDIDEEEIGALLESDLEHEVRLVSPTGTLENPPVNIPDSSAAPQSADTGNEEIEDPFLEFEDSPETPDTPDLTHVADDDLLK